jgi:hypothetical protein
MKYGIVHLQPALFNDSKSAIPYYKLLLLILPLFIRLLTASLLILTANARVLKEVFPLLRCLRCPRSRKKISTSCILRRYILVRVYLAKRMTVASVRREYDIVVCVSRASIIVVG